MVLDFVNITNESTCLLHNGMFCKAFTRRTDNYTDNLDNLGPSLLL